jgi:hypothetical protein
MAEFQAQIAVVVSASLWAVGGAGLKPGVSLLAAGGEAQAANGLSPNLR